MTKLRFGLLLSLILGAIAVFGYSPYNISIMPFISFVGLLLLIGGKIIGGKSIKHAALMGLCWGIGYFLSGVHWVYVSIRQYGELPIPIALLILVMFILYLSLYPMVFAVLLSVLRSIAPAYSIKQLVIIAPIIWQLTEFIRSNLLGGFAWLQFGYTQLNSQLKGLFPIIGINGMNLVFSCLCGLIAYILYHGLFTTKSIFTTKLSLFSLLKNFINSFKHQLGVIAVLLLTYCVTMTNNISWTQLDTSRVVNISLIQENVPQSLRWNRDQLQISLFDYLRSIDARLKESDIIILPEAAIADLELNQQQYLRQLDRGATENNATIAVGIIDLRKDHTSYSFYTNHNFYNSLIVLGDKQPYQYPTKNRYVKHHLVPFGEYIPLSSLFQPIADLLSIPMSSMSAGPEIQAPLVMKEFNFTTAICYEVILSELILKNFTPNTDFLLTVSNDAWFGDSIGPWQHLQMAQARALEFGRTLIRSTNNGITVVIDPNGNIIKKIRQFRTDTLSARLSPSIGLTPYAKWGNLLYFILLGILLSLFFINTLLLFMNKRLSKKEDQSNSLIS